MNKFYNLIDEYKIQINKYNQETLNDVSNLTHLISLSSNYLHQLRVSVRQRGFPTQADEIYFFKEIKPYIYGRLKYYTHIHSYLLNRPRVGLSKQRKFIHVTIDKFESHKLRDLEFVKYIRHKATNLDHIYFVRGPKTIAITNTINHFIDPEFSTSHDFKLARIVSYDLLMLYYKQELKNLKNKKATLIQEPPPLIKENLSWTASKTDLVELLYAINAIGAIKNGDVDIKSQAKFCETLFNIDLGNYYKTYGEIRARNKDKTKFLDNLKYSLLRKMESDDAN